MVQQQPQPQPSRADQLPSIYHSFVEYTNEAEEGIVMMLEQPEGRTECSNTMACFRKSNACQFRLGACFEFNDLGRIDPALGGEAEAGIDGAMV